METLFKHLYRQSGLRYISINQRMNATAEMHLRRHTLIRIHECTPSFISDQDGSSQRSGEKITGRSKVRGNFAALDEAARWPAHCKYEYDR
jgi:hypothetical protein